MKWRRLKTADAWHFCTNCTNWPTEPGTYIEQSTKPTTGEFDNQCLAKQRNGDCKS